MINVIECNNCIHNEVCKKKDNYVKFVNQVYEMCISPENKTVWYAKDCKDIVVDVQCNYHQAFKI